MSLRQTLHIISKFFVGFILAQLFMNCAHADPLFKKGSCVKFHDQNYGNCGGSTEEVRCEKKKCEYDIIIISCDSLYGQDRMIIGVAESNLKGCSEK